MTTCPVAIRLANCVSMNVWKVAGALHNPNVITNDSKRPNGVLKVVFSILSRWIYMLLYPHHMSNLVKDLAPNNLSTKSGISGIGAAFFFVISFRG
jgi:hypothetical protein